jgi:ATP-dependent helicase/nuclease subunit A
MNWTKAQSDAINISRRDVLVAAAAGSGKTSTLTERVISVICRDKDPVDISRLLIVTFTEKAAEELKIKIRKKLQEKAQKEPSNNRVRRQLSLLPTASISTIHSFYIRILREGFSELGLPPRLRVADEGSVEMIRRRVMNDVIDAYYNDAAEDEYRIENADEFFDTFEHIRPGEKLYDTLCELYDTVASYPEFIDFYKNCEEKYKEYANDFGKSEHFRYFKASAKKRFANILSGFDQLEADFADDEEFQNKYRPVALYCEDLIKQTLSLLDAADYKTLYEFFGKSPDIPRNKPVKGEPAFKDAQNALRDAFKTEFGKAGKLLSFNEEDVKKICLQTSYLCGCIYKVLSKFEKEFSAEKLSAGMVDFTDMERYAHRLLCRGNGEFANKIKNRYDEIYVDEYQDVNRIQDAIFASVSKNNRFMVGDVKQSIYSFRGSDPTVFSEYRDRFSPFDSGKAAPSVIFLSENFRCGKPIIDFTNEVFGHVFGQGGAIPYTKDDELVFGKTAQVREDVPVKLAVFPGGNIEDEAEYAAKEIKYLLKNGKKDDGTKITLSDIAVICEKGKVCKAVEKVFSERGLDCVNTSDKSFFDAPEVLLVISLLSAIDNPMTDVALAAAMKSPVFGFTLDELAKIRLHKQNEPLYTALCSFAEDTGDEKCAAFIRKLSYLRYRSRTMQTDKFIRLFYRQTSVLSVI